MIIKANQFNTRKDLDVEIERRFGASNEEKPTHTIRGTREEVTRLGLSDLKKVYGIGVEITDTPTEKRKPHDKPERGERFPSGLNIKK